MKNKIYLISGKWRKSTLYFPERSSVRPTHHRIRETLFNWLTIDILNMRCLDLFAGSGVLGFEALSRGAAWVDFVEKHADIVSFLEKSQLKLSANQQSAIYHKSALNFLLQQKGKALYDLIFLDPPYDSVLLYDSLELILNLDLLNADHGMIYVEYPINQDPVDTNKWIFMKQGKTKTIKYGLLKIKPKC